MNVKYFKDTDTLFIQLTDKEVAESKEINENILIDLDSNGNLVSMTVEHASLSAKVAEFSFQQIPA